MRRLLGFLFVFFLPLFSCDGTQSALNIRLVDADADGSTPIKPLVISAGDGVRGSILVVVESSDFSGEFDFGPVLLTDGADIVNEAMGGEVVYDTENDALPDNEPPPYDILPGGSQNVYVIIDPVDCLASGGPSELRLLVGPSGGTVSAFLDVYVETTDPC